MLYYIQMQEKASENFFRRIIFMKNLFLIKKFQKMYIKSIPLYYYINDDNDLSLLAYPLVSQDEETIKFVYICVNKGEITVDMIDASFEMLIMFGNHVVSKVIDDSDDDYENLIHLFPLNKDSGAIRCSESDIDNIIKKMITAYGRETGDALIEPTVDSYLSLAYNIASEAMVIILASLVNLL